MYAYDLVLGLPHTNHTGLAEHLLLMYAGDFQWTSIARAIGRPLSELRTRGGGEVYATFYFIEERFPEAAPIDSFRLDHHLTFAIFLRAFKNLAVEGQVLFDHEARIAATLAGAGDRPGPDAIAGHPYIRLANIFVTPEAGNRRLRVAPPANADFSGLAALPNMFGSAKFQGVWFQAVPNREIAIEMQVPSRARRPPGRRAGTPPARRPENRLHQRGRRRERSPDAPVERLGRYRPRFVVVEDTEADVEKSAIVRFMKGHGYDVCVRNVIILDKLHEYFFVDRMAVETEIH